MRIEVRQYRLTGPGGRPAPVTGVLGKLVAFVAATALVVLAFIFSVVLLAVLVTGGLALFGYFYQIDDLIERYRPERDFFFRNRGEAEIEGIELEGQAALSFFLKCLTAVHSSGAITSTTRNRAQS